MPTANIPYESVWHPTQNEAEEECREEMDRLIEEATSEIEDGGGRVVGATSGGYQHVEKDTNGDGQPDSFKCSTYTVLEWIVLP
jgi:hypothetical protein